MKNRIFVFLMLVISFASKAQELSWKWMAKDSFLLHHEDAVWMVDGLDNFYLGELHKLVKYDSTGVLKFKQSVSGFGEIRQLVSINPMKLVYFSEIGRAHV